MKYLINTKNEMRKEKNSQAGLPQQQIPIIVFPD